MDLVNPRVRRRLDGELNIVGSLPKTRSREIMRRVFKAEILDRSPGDITTVEDGTVEGGAACLGRARRELAAQPELHRDPAVACAPDRLRSRSPSPAPRGPRPGPRAPRTPRRHPRRASTT